MAAPTAPMAAPMASAAVTSTAAVAAMPKAIPSATAHPPEVASTAASADQVELDFVTGKADMEGRTLDQRMSLKPGDDERTEISKKISWILRHGAKKVNVDIDGEGWVPLKALLTSDILFGISEERLLSVIHDSNQQKMRYEIKDEAGRCVIRAVSKSRRREGRDGAGRRERRSREEEPRRELSDRGDRDRGDRERGDRERGDRERGDRERRGKGSGKDSSSRGGTASGGGGSNQEQEDEGLTFEQQLQLGYRPVYQGGTILAMSRDVETVRPGRRTDALVDRHQPMDRVPKGDSKGKGKINDFEADGKGHGKSQGKGSKGSKGGGKKGDDDTVAIAEGSKGERFTRGGKDGGSRQLRHWRVVHEDPAIVRSSNNVESEQIGEFKPGTVVVQIGDDKVMRNGVVRMLVESIDQEAPFRGWVTRTAEAAGGPVFFKADRGGIAGGGRDRKGNASKGIARSG